VKWPEKATLLWNGCYRSKLNKWHKYPDTIRLLILSFNAQLLQNAAVSNIISLDPRTNGPAVVAFGVAGGIRPTRAGSKNNWSVHHIYSGKFPYDGRVDTLHASHEGKHFTQSAGLVAIHPIADQICDEYPFFSWLLRAMAFMKFGYDPDQVFSTEPHDEFGFLTGKGCFVVPMLNKNTKIMPPG
jgi:hypothetical protein